MLGSEVRLQQIFRNLLSNAIKFSPAGQTIDVTLTSDEDAVVVEVSDTGEGIAPEALPRIFERFQQANASARRIHGGLGLGLSIVRSLTQLHNGTVQVFSAGIGKGAKFTVRLPRAHGTAVLAPTPKNNPHECTLLTGTTVLVVDDEADMRQVLSRSLIECGATVTCVGSLAECLASLRAVTPDVIISDLMMPEVDGFGLIERIRTHPNPEIARLPVLALTAHASAEDHRRAITSGFTTYLTKPFELGTLSQMIKELVSKSKRAD